MTIRLLLEDEGRAFTRPGSRWIEYVLLVVGLIGVDYYIWSNTNEVLSQAYDSWSLNQLIKGAQPTVRGFIADELHLPWLAAPPEKAIVQVEQNERNPSASIRPQHRERPARMALLGRVGIPRLGLSASVRQGTDDGVLAAAVGHMPSTALPGDYGNVAIAAHRDTLFRKLRDIKKEDRITFETPDGKSYDYAVESTKIVDPKDVSVLRANKDDRVLTLITCYPFNFIGHAPQRFIVHARQTDVTAQSQRLRSKQTQTDF